MTSEKRKAQGSSAQRLSDRRRRESIIETALVEPNSLFREGVEHILARTRLQVVIKAEAISALLALPAGHKGARLAILSTEGSDAPNASITQLKDKYPDCRVVCIIQSDHSNESINLLRSGADGVLLRSISADAFIRSLELVMLGERVLPAAALSAACSSERREPAPSNIAPPGVEQPCNAGQGSRKHNLSFRELAILRCLVQGESNKVIAHNLDIAEATVKVHVKAILRKIHVQNRTQAAIWALHHLDDREPAGLDRKLANGGNGSTGPIILPDDASIQRP